LASSRRRLSGWNANDGRSACDSSAGSRRGKRQLSNNTPPIEVGGVQHDLKLSLADAHGPDDIFPPSRDELIAAFLEAYSEIDWKVHGRLKHFRNLGIAHLTVEKMSKSITFDELREFVSIISRLTVIIQELCHTPTSFRESMLEDYRDIARNAMIPPA
jgi:hypothetical protein